MTPTHLTLAAVAALAAAGAARRGSRAQRDLPGALTPTAPAGYMPPFAGLAKRRDFDEAHGGTDQNPMRDLDEALSRGRAPDRFAIQDTMEWLERQRQSGRWGRNTYWYYTYPELSVAKLLTLPGQKGEHEYMGTTEKGRFSEDYLDKLATSMRQEGFKAERAIQVFTWSDGTATIWEGNHRLRAAQRAGLETIPVDWRYVAGSERDPNAPHASDYAVDR